MKNKDVQNLTYLVSLIFTISSCAIAPLDRPGKKYSDETQLDITVKKHEGLTVNSTAIDEEIARNEELESQDEFHRDELIDMKSEVDEAAEDPTPYENPAFMTYEKDERVQDWIDYFAKKDHDRFQRFINNGEPIRRDIEKIFEKHNLPRELYYVGLIESGYYMRARSRASAVGPWQFIRSAAKDYGLKVNSLIDERKDLFKATEAAALYFKDLYNIFGSWELALSGYNAGPNRIIYLIRRENTRDFKKLSRSRRFPKETAHYIPKVQAVREILANPQAYNFIKPETPSIFSNTQTIPLKYSLSLSTIAKKIDTPIKRLKELNPELTAGRTPYNKSGYYDLRVPSEKIESHASTIASLKTYKASRPYSGGSSQRYARTTAPSSHKVRRGENLYLIARKYGTSVRKLKKVNDLRRSRIYTGQKLKIPSGSFHVVRRGENLSLIAKKYNTNVRKLKRSNGMRSSRIFAGQKLRLPSSATKSSRTYTVRRGDNLHRIAARFGKTLGQIKSLNDLESSKIFPGQKLHVR